MKAIMIQGTTSDAGKSALATGLCRALYRRGVRVAPFKPQNMALNSAVTIDHGEIGRAQAVQAQACHLLPHTDMNPVLLKPNSETGSQVIIQGQAIGNMNALDFHGYKVVAMSAVMDSFKRLSEQYEVIVVEGAGSPAEINLRHNDIANMGFAEAVDCPVILVADIERGGVFAQLAGTLALLSASEQRRIKGLIINRFRGELNLLIPGINWLEAHTQKPVYGVLPYERDLYLAAEDSLNQTNGSATGACTTKIIAPAFPRMSNHTDFDALCLHPHIDFQFIQQGQAIPVCDLIILPGSKNISTDLRWLKQGGWDKAIMRHLRYQGKLMGICGGYQMLGKLIHDPQGVEGPDKQMTGLSLIDASTTLQTQKKLTRVSGNIIGSHYQVEGYEIHMGVTQGSALNTPFLQLEGGVDGMVSDDGQIIGTYVHGFFDSSDACRWLMHWLELPSNEAVNFQNQREQGIDRIADLMEQHLDMQSILALVDV